MRTKSIPDVRDMSDEEFTRRVAGQPLSVMVLRYTLGVNTFYQATTSTRSGFVVTGRILDPTNLAGLNEAKTAFIVPRESVVVPTPTPQKHRVKKTVEVTTEAPAEATEPVAEATPVVTAEKLKEDIDVDEEAFFNAVFGEKAVNE